MNEKLEFAYLIYRCIIACLLISLVVAFITF